MTRTFASFVFAVAVSVGGPVLAQSPDGSPGDLRIRDIPYAPDEVVRITGAFRTATQIVFSPDETILHAAIGDSVAWEVAAEGSILFLKPREQAAATNLLVVTERAGRTRHYAFELSARERSDRTPIAYQIRFRYPEDERLAAAAALDAQARVAEAEVIGLELQHGTLMGPRNLAWTAQGDVDLQPSEVTDNGRFTVMRFPGQQAIPALFEVGDDGSERLIPYDVRGEFVVIHGVPRALRLRRGNAILCLFNEAWSPAQAQTHTGTASPVSSVVPQEMRHDREPTG